MSYILRRRKLGRTSAREVAKASTTSLEVYRNDGHKLDLNTGVYRRRYRGFGGSVRRVRDLPVSDYVFRYGCVSPVPAEVTVVNTVRAIQTVNDKAQFRYITAQAGLAPKTWLSASTIYSIDKPLVLRPRVHAQGRNVHVINNVSNLNAWAYHYGEGNYYVSELIDKVAEYRVFVCSGRVVWVAKKTPGNPSDVAWNVARGGRFDNVRWSEWPLSVLENAIKSFKLSGLDFGGVDVMVDADGRAYTLEINSAPSQTSPYRQSATARAFDYIVRNGPGAIELDSELSGYRKYIHPGLLESNNSGEPSGPFA